MTRGMRRLRQTIDDNQNDICRENPTINVVFWNTQRLSRNNEEKFGFAFNNMERWIQHNGFRPDILCLSEVPQTGRELENEINTIRRIWRVNGYQARFIEVPDINGNISPCSFLVAYRGNRFNIRPAGASTRRPYIQLTVRNEEIVIGCCHITATQREPSADEITTMITDLNHFHSAVLIGDMNFRFNSTLPEGEENIIRRMGWRKESPNFPTFRPRSRQQNPQPQPYILDYIWKNQNIINCQPTELIQNYNRWDLIDHAPIAYRITY